MSEIWPFDVKRKIITAPTEAIRPFKCILLMPFEGRFNQVAEFIRDTVSEVIEQFADGLAMQQPIVKRLDWITSSGVIQQEIWQEIVEADLVFCDITGYNPNVMFESGVCAAWKEMKQVVFIKDRFFKQQSAFDIAPIRYTEYEFASDGMDTFRNKIARLTQNVLIGFPDQLGSSQPVQLPLKIRFSDNRDDLRIHTPPFAHRRVIDGTLEFGSLNFFNHSWATVGKEIFHNFTMEFSAKFSNPLQDGAFIGVGLRSQHFFANFAHILYLKHDGSIIITEPNEEPPLFYKDNLLRKAVPIDLSALHLFRITFNESILSVEVDDFSYSFEIAKMKKVFGAGLIRFQASRSWMAIDQLEISSE